MGEGSQDRLVILKPYSRKVLKDFHDYQIIAHPETEETLPASDVDSIVLNKK